MLSFVKSFVIVKRCSLFLIPQNLPAMAGDILHFAEAFFLEFRVSDGQNLVHNQNLVCAPPGSQSPAGLPAAAYLGVPSASVQAPNAPRPQTPAAHTSPSYTG
jgi:hypothetical protein